MKWLHPKKERTQRWLKTPEQEARALEQRAENARAASEGKALPYPNPWDVWDPSKVPQDATPEQITQRYREFSQLCRPQPRRQHTI